MGIDHILLLENPAHVSIDTGRLRIRKPECPDAFFAPGDVAAVIFDHNDISISHGALRKIAESGSTLVITNERHIPCAQIISDNANSLTVKRIRGQISHEGSAQAGLLWKSIVEVRLKTEACNLRRLKLSGALHLERLCEQILPGDPTNVEANAARYYWPRLFKDFIRTKRGAEDPINTRLNYGYAVLRAIVTKELVALGLNPGIGIKHRNATNTMNLADDLMEPFRFVVEHQVSKLNLDVEFKGHAKLDVLGFLDSSISSAGFNYRLIPAIRELAVSYIRVLEGRTECLSLPTGWGRDEFEE